MRIYNVWDSDGYDAEERGHVLIAAESEEQAIALYDSALGVGPDDHGDIAAKPAEWRWPTVPEPVPTVPGRWHGSERTEFGAAFRGYGFWDEDDPLCEACDEHVDEHDMVGEGDDRVCRWCAPVAPAPVVP